MASSPGTALPLEAPPAAAPPVEALPVDALPDDGAAEDAPAEGDAALEAEDDGDEADELGAAVDEELLPQDEMSSASALIPAMVAIALLADVRDTRPTSVSWVENL